MSVQFTEPSEIITVHIYERVAEYDKKLAKPVSFAFYYTYHNAYCVVEIYQHIFLFVQEATCQVIHSKFMRN